MNMPSETAVAETHEARRGQGVVFRTWMCILCGWVYDEQEGDIMSGLAPATVWNDVPDDWTCPDCGVGKDEFELVEI